MQKPPVDIEWYDDGFTMEEQAEMAKEFSRVKRASRIRVHITENQQENWKDQLIEKLQAEIKQLKVQNAANEEYIKELEDEERGSSKYQEMKELNRQLKIKNIALENSNKQVKGQLGTLNRRYNEDIEKYFIAKYQEEINKITANVEMYIRQRDEAIKRILELTDGKRISK